MRPATQLANATCKEMITFLWEPSVKSKLRETPPSSQVLGFKAEVNKKGAKSVSNAPPKPKLATDRNDMAYCLTHGFPGLVAEATSNNDLGGCVDVWQPKTKKM
jgi:hypothetical protein